MTQSIAYYKHYALQHYRYFFSIRREMKSPQKHILFLHIDFLTDSLIQKENLVKIKKFLKKTRHNIVTICTATRGVFSKRTAWQHAHVFSNGSDDTVYLSTSVNEGDIILLHITSISEWQNYTIQLSLPSVSFARRIFLFVCLFVLLFPCFFWKASW